MATEDVKNGGRCFVQKEPWLDLDGDPINAHGCGMLKVGGIYYLYGEYKKGITGRTHHIKDWDAYYLNAIGFSCYSSENLVDWKYQGISLPSVSDDANHDLHSEMVMERPKVVYNRRTKKYVMWFHVDDRDYKVAKVGVAVSDEPAGPYAYQGSLRPNGNESRDMTVFADDDGEAYLFYSSEGNETLRICRLSADYLSCTREEVRVFEGCRREAPAVFKYRGRFYMLTSGCTGWDPNAAMLASANSIFGEWIDLGNPCRGPKAETTFETQFSYVLPLSAEAGSFLALADRWNKVDLEKSTYVWLPFLAGTGEWEIHWRDCFETPLVLE